MSTKFPLLIWALVLASATMFLLCGGDGSFASMAQLLRNNIFGQAQKASSEPSALPLPQAETILFMGTDVVYKDPYRRHADRDSVQGNSDTMMLAFLDPRTNSLSVLHVPRDTRAVIGRFGVHKINSANRIGGPQLSKSALESLLGIAIDHYVVMNIHGLEELVNELGGLTVTVPKKMSYMDWTGKLKIDLQPGVHTLTGNQSMGFVRFRHDELGDIGRIQRQQIFLQAVFSNMMKPRSWLHVPNLINIARKNIQTDMDLVQIMQAVNFLHSVPREGTKFVMLPGTFAANGDWLASSKAPTLAQGLQNSSQETAQDRRRISVCIVNASSNRMLGTHLSNVLRTMGYSTWVLRNRRDDGNSKTRIIAQDGNIVAAKMLQADLGNIGEIIAASIGDISSNITIVAHDDLELEQVGGENMPDKGVLPWHL